MLAIGMTDRDTHRDRRVRDRGVEGRHARGRASIQKWVADRVAERRAGLMASKRTVPSEAADFTDEEFDRIVAEELQRLKEFYGDVPYTVDDLLAEALELEDESNRMELTQEPPPEITDLDASFMEDIEYIESAESKIICPNCQHNYLNLSEKGRLSCVCGVDLSTPLSLSEVKQRIEQTVGHHHQYCHAAFKFTWNSQGFVISCTGDHEALAISLENSSHPS
eukprot:Clim_evm13s166 gene=Clim_evmTU13s166